MGNFTYIPAEVPGACSMNKNIFGIFNGEKKRLGWWRPDSIFNYPNILVSAHYGTKHPQLRKELEFPNKGIVIGDSGGFQMMSLKEWKGQDIHINPVDVFNWQLANCDIGLPLDYPPFSDTEVAWKKSLEISDKNFKIAEDLFKQQCHKPTVNPGIVDEHGNSTFYLYNVFQGYGFDKRRMDEWFNMANKYTAMSDCGWAFGCKPEAKPMLIAYQAMYMYFKGFKKNFHFLAVSGSRTIPVMAYLARYIDNITSDSSGWAQGAMQRKYFMPGYFGKFEIFLGKRGNGEMKSLPCSCPVCEQVGENIGILSADGSAPGGIISLHNLYQIILFAKTCNSLKDDSEIYKAFVKKMFDAEVLKAIEFIDYSLEQGFEAACIKFRNYFFMQTSKAETGGLLDY